MAYRIVIERPAEKSLRRRIPPEHADRIRRAVDALAENPSPPGSLELRGRQERRLRVSDYRVIYVVDDTRRLVTVMQAGHRKDVYR